MTFNLQFSNFINRQLHVTLVGLYTLIALESSGNQRDHQQGKSGGQEKFKYLTLRFLEKSKNSKYAKICHLSVTWKRGIGYELV